MEAAPIERRPGVSETHIQHTRTAMHVQPVDPTARQASDPQQQRQLTRVVRARAHSPIGRPPGSQRTRGAPQSGVVHAKNTTSVRRTACTACPATHRVKLTQGWTVPTPPCRRNDRRSETDTMVSSNVGWAGMRQTTLQRHGGHRIAPSPQHTRARTHRLMAATRQATARHHRAGQTGCVGQRRMLDVSLEVIIVANTNAAIIGAVKSVT